MAGKMVSVGCARYARLPSKTAFSLLEKDGKRLEDYCGRCLYECRLLYLWALQPEPSTYYQLTGARLRRGWCAAAPRLFGWCGAGGGAASGCSAPPLLLPNVGSAVSVALLACRD